MPQAQASKALTYKLDIQHQRILWTRPFLDLHRLLRTRRLPAALRMQAESQFVLGKIFPTPLMAPMESAQNPCLRLADIQEIMKRCPQPLLPLLPLAPLLV